MTITRLFFPAILFLLAVLVWPIGISVLAVTVVMDIGQKRDWHPVDMIAAGTLAMAFIFWLGVVR